MFEKLLPWKRKTGKGLKFRIRISVVIFWYKKWNKTSFIIISLNGNLIANLNLIIYVRNLKNSFRNTKISNSTKKIEKASFNLSL